MDFSRYTYKLFLLWIVDWKILSIVQWASKNRAKNSKWNWKNFDVKEIYFIRTFFYAPMIRTSIKPNEIIRVVKNLIKLQCFELEGDVVTEQDLFWFRWWNSHKIFGVWNFKNKYESILLTIKNKFQNWWVDTHFRTGSL